MGRLLRHYWMPIAGVSEFDRLNTKPIKLLGEELVLYRDRGGEFGLIAGSSQGDVESLASRKSDELLKFFESVSGSDKYLCVRGARAR